MVAGLRGAPGFLIVLQFSCFMLHAPAMPFRAGETIILLETLSYRCLFLARCVFYLFASCWGVFVIGFSM